MVSARSKIDSLLNIANSQPNNSSKVDVLLDLYKLLKANNPDTSIILMNEARLISDSINYVPGQFISAYYLGILNYRKGNLNESKHYFLKSLAITDHLKREMASRKNLNALGIVCKAQGDFKEAKKYYDKSYEIACNSNDTAAMSVCLNNLGEIFVIFGDYTKADECLNSAVEFYKAINDDVGLVTGLAAYGSFKLKQGKISEASDLVNKALKIARDLDNKDLEGHCLSELGQVYGAQGDYGKAVEYFEKAIGLSKKLGDRSLEADLLEQIGEMHERQSNLIKAALYYKKSLAIRMEISEYSTVIKNYGNLGSLYILMDSMKIANDYLQQALRLSKDKKNQSTEANVYHLFSKMYLIQNDLHLAQNYAQQALLIHSKLGESKNIADDYLQLGEIVFKQKKYGEAEKNAKKAFKIANKINVKEEKKEAAEMLAECYHSLGDFEKAYEYYVCYKQVYDSIFNMESHKTITAIESKFDLERKQQRILLQDNELEKNQLELKQKQLVQNFLVASIFLFIIIIIIIILYGQKLKRASKKILQQNNEIKEQSEEIIQQRNVLENQNAKNEKSINYAKHIQTAAFPSQEQMESVLPKSFVYFEPCEIVSGDFYWISIIKNKIIIAAGDCTGHGVPGALMSMLGLSFIKDVNLFSGDMNAAKVLDVLREKVKSNLNQNKESEYWDGMDMGLCIIDIETDVLNYAGAHHSLIYIRDNECLTIKGDKQPISSYLKERKFTDHVLEMQPDDIYYLYSDGFPDQMGGEHYERFQTRRLNEFLLANHSQLMSKQKKLLADMFVNWKGDNEQIDDVVVIGFRL